MQNEEDFDNYLIATIKLPIKVGIDGNLYTLNDYVNITIENMMDTPIKSADSIHDKVVEYITKHPEYFKRRKPSFREIIAQEFDPQEFDPQEFDTQEFDPQEFDTQEFDPQEFDPQEVDVKEVDVKEVDVKEFDVKEFDVKEFDVKEFDVKEFDTKTNENQTLLHSFPYFNRRKKPLNITFRAKGKSRSFTKKNYF
jgi:hypothetical protein